MKYIISFITCLFLTGCAIPVTQKFPDAVPELQKTCPDLEKIDSETVSITDMLKVIVKNYNLYYQCSNKVDEWNIWYNKQKQIFELELL